MTEPPLRPTAATSVRTPSGVAARTLVRLGLRSIFGRRRGILLFLLPVVLVGLAALVRFLVGDELEATKGTLYGLGLVVVMPLVALLATTGVLAPEIDDGSISFLLAKPVSRLTIVLSKLAVAWGCVAVFAALPLLVAGVVLQPTDPRVGAGFAVGAVVGGAAYCALFGLLSVVTRHAVVFGLVYLLVWETLLGGLLDGVRWLSLSRWAGEVTEPIADVFLVPGLSLPYAVIAVSLVVVGGTWAAGSRLRGFNLTGDE